MAHNALRLMMSAARLGPRLQAVPSQTARERACQARVASADSCSRAMKANQAIHSIAIGGARAAAMAVKLRSRIAALRTGRR